MNTEKRYTIGFVGKGFSGTVQDVREKGYKVVLFYDDESQQEFAENFYAIYKVNFDNENLLRNSLVNQNIEVDALISTYEKYIYPRAMLAKVLGLKGPSLESAEAITDKHLQRNKYKEFAPEITPKFNKVSQIEDIKNLNMDFPVILKPTNLMKSLLVSKCKNQDELEETFNISIQTIQEIYKAEKINREPNLIVEEFLEGTAHSIELFVDDKGDVHTPGVVVDVIKANEIGVEDNYEYVRILPSSLNKEKAQNVIEAAKKGIKALGITNNTGHAEIIYTKNGPKIIEINGRIGGYRDRMYRLSYGIELVENEVKMYLGEKPEFNASKNSYTAVFELFPDNAGKFIEITNVDKLEDLDSFEYFSSKKEVGDDLGLSRDGFRSAGILIINNDDRQKFEEDLEFIKSSVKVIVN